MVKVAVLVSGGGTNLQAILDAKAAGRIPSGELSLVVSSKSGVHALERAAGAGIPHCVVRRADYTDSRDFDKALLDVLRDHRIDFVVLAGFLCILGPDILSAYRDRIINVHPSLIPSFCGDGFYGLKVHQAALDRGVKVTGATVHLVNEITDGGRILFQKAVDIREDDTAETLQKRVMEEAEWQILPRALELCCRELRDKRKEEA